MGAGVLLLVASGAVTGSPAAAEAMLEVNGWWYKPNQVPNNLFVPPAPPGVPSDGLWVAADPSGPVGIAAVRYLAFGAGTLTLKFSPSGNNGIASIAACVALTKWDGASAGRWEGKPIYDCSRQSVGVLSKDKSEMAWPLDPSMQKEAGVYDIVLAPIGPVPFSASFNVPRSSNLVTDGSGSPEPVPATAESFDPTEDAPSGGDFAPFETTFPVLDESRTAAPVDVGSEAPPATPRITTQIVPAVANPLALPDDRNERLAAMVGLGLLLLGAWWFGGRTVRAPRLLGSVAGRANAVILDPADLPADVTDAPVRGIGRFSRPRV